MKTKNKPLKAPPTPGHGPPKGGKIAGPGAGLAGTEFSKLAPEEYEAACVFEMIVDMSPSEREAIPEHLQAVVRAVEAVEVEPERARSNRPSWMRWRESNPRLKSRMVRKTRGSVVAVGQANGPAVSVITGDEAAFINDQVRILPQPERVMSDTSWPLTLPTKNPDPQTIALTIRWEAGLHQIGSEITQWLEKNAPPGTPGNKAGSVVDTTAPAKGRSPYKRAESILRLIAICRILKSGSKPRDIPNRLASQSSVAHAKGNLIREYGRILKVNPPRHLAKAR